jgi:glycosyltransferase involved in cell wall biosynthesis
VKGKAIVTVHDMTIHRFPETVRAKTKYMLHSSLKKSLKRADAVMTISEFSKSELLQFYDYPPEKIQVIHCGVDPELYNDRVSEEAVINAKAKYGIAGEYQLYLGTLEPRKNIERLVEAYARRKANVPRLVLAGGRGWLYEGIFEKVRALNLENAVIFTGYVDDGDKAALYSGAEFFVFPSLYEGFGMPPLEAMACGTPVLTSNAASLPEVCGDCAVYIDPYSTEDIADAMEKLSGDAELRKRLSAQGLEQAQKFSWDDSAGKLFNVYQGMQ